MKTIHPGHLEHRFCIFGCQILCITDLAIMPHMIYDLKRSIEWLEGWPRRDVQPVCRKRSSVMSTKVESGERAVRASLFFPTSRATHAAQQLSSGQKWASGGQLWLCGRQGSIG